MAKNNISIEDIAELLDIHRNSASNKINGKTKFLIKEAFDIQKKFFPDLATDYLFANDED